ncbi:type I toxin-antitoxin system Ibs family toxin, partial [Escherichia coli]
MMRLVIILIVLLLISF